MADTAQLVKIAEGREAEMFAWNGGRVLRLYREGRSPEQAERQVTILRAASAADIRVPEVFGLETVAGRPGIVMERIDGLDLLTVMGGQPWKIFGIGSLCGRVHARINEAAAPADLPTTNERLRRGLTDSPLVPEQYAAAALDRLQELAEGDRFCHGDFHPANVMIHHGEPVVLDWTGCTRGPPEADFARSLLILSLGDPPPGTSVTIRILATFGRYILRALYNRSYRRARKVDDELLRAWELPVAVARLTDGITSERQKLTKHIDRLLLRG